MKPNGALGIGEHLGFRQSDGADAYCAESGGLFCLFRLFRGLCSGNSHCRVHDEIFAWMLPRGRGRLLLSNTARPSGLAQQKSRPWSYEMQGGMVQLRSH